MAGILRVSKDEEKVQTTNPIYFGAVKTVVGMHNLEVAGANPAPATGIGLAWNHLNKSAERRF